MENVHDNNLHFQTSLMMADPLSEVYTTANEHQKNPKLRQT